MLPDCPFILKLFGDLDSDWIPCGGLRLLRFTSPQRDESDAGWLETMSKKDRAAGNYDLGLATFRTYPFVASEDFA
jgi:hypothetical protein